MVRPGPARGPGRAWPGRGGPGLRIQARWPYGPKRAEKGLMMFYLRFLCALCAGRWVVTRELCMFVTCKGVVTFKFFLKNFQNC